MNNAHRMILKRSLKNLGYTTLTSKKHILAEF